MSEPKVEPKVASRGRDEVDMEEALAGVTPEQLSKLEFIINGDGSVTFIDFPPELMDIAYALNPDDPVVCERMALLSASGAAPAAAPAAVATPVEPDPDDA